MMTCSAGIKVHLIVLKTGATFHSSKRNRHYLIICVFVRSLIVTSFMKYILLLHLTRLLKRAF